MTAGLQEELLCQAACSRGAAKFRQLRKALLSSGFGGWAPVGCCWINGAAPQPKGFVSPFLAACKASGSGHCVVWLLQFQPR